MSFESELESFRRLQELLGPSTVYLIDSYDTIEGARKAASLGEPVWGVRLDSGNLAELAHTVRGVLDSGGMAQAKIMATSDLNEYKILEIMAARAPVDAFGVGTELATSADAPAISAVYKLVQLETARGRRYTAKFSADKHTMPGVKQVFRWGDRDEIACAEERREGAVPLLAQVISGGKLVRPLPAAQAAREHARRSIAALPQRIRSLFEAEDPYPIGYTAEMSRLLERVRRQTEEAAQ
jgi:nicotinate phosphoribosyltransferase